MESKTITEKYKSIISQRYNDLLISGKKPEDFDNYDLSKIFEYYTCIQLAGEYSTPFYEYNDINKDYKEKYGLTKADSGVDASNMKDIAVQCKLRSKTLCWGEFSTFLGSNQYVNEDKKLSFIWDKQILARNDDCDLSTNMKLKLKNGLFIDKTYSRNDIIEYCKSLPLNENIIKPVLDTKTSSRNKKKNTKPDNKTKQPKTLKDYQVECVNLIKENKQNIVICLPTGTGKSLVIVSSMEAQKKYLILVPRIILMEQFSNVITEERQDLKDTVQCIGDSKNEYNESKNIVICVYNSIDKVKPYLDTFEKIFIDEAHHVKHPEIYAMDEYVNMGIEDENEDLNDDYSDEEFNEDKDEEIEEDDETEDNDETEDDNNASDEENNKPESYIHTIRSLSRYNNNVYLSATINEQDGFLFYKKDIRDMIENKYLCDYLINIPIFKNDPTNTNVCKYLIQNYRSIIVYCNSQKEGKEINKLFNKIRKNCSEYIDCNTAKKKRDDITERFKTGELAFLVNVRILVEGFDANITNGVCFMHLPSNKTTLVQIIGRALRLHEDKTFANVILPFSNDGDETAINNFLKIMARNDSRIMKSYSKKTLGSDISFEFINDDSEYNDNGVVENEDKELDNDFELKFNMIFDSMGNIKNGEEYWIMRLEEVKKYIDLNNKTPSKENKNPNIKKLGIWISIQKRNYNPDITLCKERIKLQSIHKLWTDFINDTKYSKYIVINHIEDWKKNLINVKTYMDLYYKKPSCYDKNPDTKKLGNWLVNQKQNYNPDITLCKRRLKTIEIHKLFTEFINNSKYKQYIILNPIEDWKNNLTEIKNYIDLNKKCPSTIDKNPDIKKLGIWLGTQKRNYNTVITLSKQIMKIQEIHKLFTEFINNSKYKQYIILNPIEDWKNNLTEIKNYIDLNKKCPSTIDKNPDIKKLAYWISHQKENYNSDITLCQQIMKKYEVHKLFKEFINNPKYKHLLSPIEDWKNNIIEVKKYIDLNNTNPKKEDKNKDIKKLGIWISYQKKNYNPDIALCNFIMKTPEIHKLFTEFINNPKYTKHIIISPIEDWKNNLKEVKKYIDENNKRPSHHNKDINIKKLGGWLGTQKKNYNKDIKLSKQIMKDQDIYSLWTQFINDDKYKQYF
jgi:superfamily II DNA or RNA helicase